MWKNFMEQSCSGYRQRQREACCVWHTALSHNENPSSCDFTLTAIALTLFFKKEIFRPIAWQLQIFDNRWDILYNKP